LTISMPGGVPARKVRVLFVNTRSALQADVAVHLTLIQNFDPAEVVAFIATNRNSVDLDKTLHELAVLPPTQRLVMDLGHEMAISRGGKGGKVTRMLRNLGLVAALARLVWFVKRHKIDVIHSTDRPRDALVATLLSRLTGCPNVIHMHIAWYPELGRLTQMGLERCRATLAISQFVRHTLVEGGVPAAKIYTVLNATAPDRFDPRTTPCGRLRADLGLSPETPLIGIVARVILWKGHRELIQALAGIREQIPDVHLAIVGHEDLAASSGVQFSAELRQLVADLGLKQCVHWVGWRDDAAQVIADLDVVAVPSWAEPFGLVVTEAMSMQRPLVGCHSGGLPEIVTDGVEGVLVPPRDPAALATALLALLKDPDLRVKMGQRGRERVCRQFTPARQAREMAEVYRRILAGLPDTTPNAAKDST
jgi:glycosyltransferase involved in cell wall biosynthesis